MTAPVDSSYDVPVYGACYYQPFKDNGPLATQFKIIGAQIGNAIGSLSGEEYWPLGPTVFGMMGNFIGGMAGQEAGFYADNFSAINHNIEAFMCELYSYAGGDGLPSVDGVPAGF